MEYQQKMINNKGERIKKIEQMKFEDFQKLQEEWMKTFELDDIDQDFIPELPQKLRGYFKQDIHLKIGSLYKLITRDRVESIGNFGLIKKTPENPDIVIKDDRGFLFVKNTSRERAIFASVTKNIDDEMIVTSNYFKRISILINTMFDRQGELIYEKQKGLLIDIIEQKINYEIESLRLLKQKLKTRQNSMENNGRSR